ncbi:MAG TPA: GDSL-type esterase/lipase family protein [Acidobacteriaceae bacterium]
MAQQPVVAPAITTPTAHGNDCHDAELAAAGGNPAATPTPHFQKVGWDEREQAKLQEARAHPPQIVFLGDSITRNWDLNRPDALEKLKPIFDSFYGDRQPLNLGISADTTSNVLWRIEHGAFDGISPRLIVVLIGTNNTLRCKWTAAQTQGGIDKVVDELHTRVPQAKILLMGILPKQSTPEIQAEDREVNSYLAIRYGKSGSVTFVDAGYVFLKGGELDTSLFMDPILRPGAAAVHPTPQGGKRMLQAIEPTVARLYGDKEKRVP